MSTAFATGFSLDSTHFKRFVPLFDAKSTVMNLLKKSAISFPFSRCVGKTLYKFSAHAVCPLVFGIPQTVFFV